MKGKYIKFLLIFEKSGKHHVVNYLQAVSWQFGYKIAGNSGFNNKIRKNNMIRF